MSEPVELELAVATLDDASIREIEAALSEVSPQRWPESRELLTIITVAASVVALVNALVDLRDKLAKRHAPAPPPAIVIRNVERLELNLADATPETLSQFLAAGHPGST